MQVGKIERIFTENSSRVQLGAGMLVDTNRFSLMLGRWQKLQTVSAITTLLCQAIPAVVSICFHVILLSTSRCFHSIHPAFIHILATLSVVCLIKRSCYCLHY